MAEATGEVVSSTSNVDNIKNLPTTYRIFAFGKMRVWPLSRITGLLSMDACSICVEFFIQVLHWISDGEGEIHLPILYAYGDLYRLWYTRWREGRENSRFRMDLHIFCLTTLNEFFIKHSCEFKYDFSTNFGRLYTKVIYNFTCCNCGTHRGCDRLYERYN